MNKNDKLVKGAVAVIIGGCVARAIQAIRKNKVEEKEEVIKVSVDENGQQD